MDKSFLSYSPSPRAVPRNVERREQRESTRYEACETQIDRNTTEIRDSIEGSRDQKTAEEMKWPKIQIIVTPSDEEKTMPDVEVVHENHTHKIINEGIVENAPPLNPIIFVKPYTEDSDSDSD